MQGGHQVAQKFRKTTLPFKSDSLIVLLEPSVNDTSGIALSLEEALILLELDELSTSDRPPISGISGWNSPIFINPCIVQPLKSGTKTIARAKQISTAVVMLEKLNSFCSFCAVVLESVIGMLQRNNFIPKAGQKPHLHLYDENAIPSDYIWRYLNHENVQELVEIIRRSIGALQHDIRVFIVRSCATHP